MTTEERIERLRPYFVSFQIDSIDNAAILLIKFPTDEGWRLPKVEDTKSKYKTEFAQTESGIYFGTEISNGSDVLFDCVEAIIKDNKTAQEKKNLFSKKVEELKTIFSQEPLEKLYSLTFAFNEEIKYNKGKECKDKKERGKKKKSEEVEEDNKNVVAETHNSFNNVTKTQVSSLRDNDNDNGLMSLAKGIIGEK